MSKVKLELKPKTDLELLATANTHQTAMDTTEGAANFPTPEPPKLTLETARDAFEAAITAAGVAEQDFKAKVSLKNDKRRVLEGLLTDRGGYVDRVSGGDATKILTSGFEVRATPSPVGAMTAPLHLTSSMGDMSGEIDLQWDPVKGAKSYIVECRTHGATPGSWTQAKICTSSRISVTGLTPGQEYAFRVRAVGSAGEGPWSDETVKMAPA